MFRHTNTFLLLGGLLALVVLVAPATGGAVAADTVGDAPTESAQPQLDEDETPSDEAMAETPSGDATTETPDEDDAGEEETARVRAVHLSPVVPDLGVEVGFATVAENLSFGETTDYATVDAGEQSFEMERLDRGEEVFETEEDLAAGANYSIILTATITDNRTLNFTPALLRDDVSIPDADEAALRFIHVSPDLGPVDVTLADANTTVADNVSFREAGEYVTVAPGNRTLQIREEAPDNDGRVIHEAQLDLEGGTVYSSPIIGYANPDAAPIDVSLDQGLFVDANRSAAAGATP